jgi:hypothetical protein
MFTLEHSHLFGCDSVVVLSPVFPFCCEIPPLAKINSLPRHILRCLKCRGILIILTPINLTQYLFDGSILCTRPLCGRWLMLGGPLVRYLCQY